MTKIGLAFILKQCYFVIFVIFVMPAAVELAPAFCYFNCIYCCSLEFLCRYVFMYTCIYVYM